MYVAKLAGADKAAGVAVADTYAECEAARRGGPMAAICATEEEGRPRAATLQPAAEATAVPTPEEEPIPMTDWHQEAADDHRHAPGDIPLFSVEEGIPENAASRLSTALKSAAEAVANAEEDGDALECIVMKRGNYWPYIWSQRLLMVERRSLLYFATTSPAAGAAPRGFFPLQSNTRLLLSVGRVSLYGRRDSLLLGVYNAPPSTAASAGLLSSVLHASSAAFPLVPFVLPRVSLTSHMCTQGSCTSLHLPPQQQHRHLEQQQSSTACSGEYRKEYLTDVGLSHCTAPSSATAAVSRASRRLSGAWTSRLPLSLLLAPFRLLLPWLSCSCVYSHQTSGREASTVSPTGPGITEGAATCQLTRREASAVPYANTGLADSTASTQSSEREASRISYTGPSTLSYTGAGVSTSTAASVLSPSSRATTSAASAESSPPSPGINLLSSPPAAASRRSFSAPPSVSRPLLPPARVRTASASSAVPRSSSADRSAVSCVRIPPATPTACAALDTTSSPTCLPSLALGKTNLDMLDGCQSPGAQSEFWDADDDGVSAPSSSVAIPPPLSPSRSSSASSGGGTLSSASFFSVASMPTPPFLSSSSSPVLASPPPTSPSIWAEACPASSSSSSSSSSSYSSRFPPSACSPPSQRHFSLDASPPPFRLHSSSSIPCAPVSLPARRLGSLDDPSPSSLAASQSNASLSAISSFEPPRSTSFAAHALGRAASLPLPSKSVRSASYAPATAGAHVLQSSDVGRPQVFRHIGTATYDASSFPTTLSSAAVHLCKARGLAAGAGRHRRDERAQPDVTRHDGTTADAESTQQLLRGVEQRRVQQEQRQPQPQQVRQGLWVQRRLQQQQQQPQQLQQVRGKLQQLLHEESPHPGHWPPQQKDQHEQLSRSFGVRTSPDSTWNESTASTSCTDGITKRDKGRELDIYTRGERERGARLAGSLPRDVSNTSRTSQYSERKARSLAAAEPALLFACTQERFEEEFSKAATPKFLFEFADPTEQLRVSCAIARAVLRIRQQARRKHQRRKQVLQERLDKEMLKRRQEKVLPQHHHVLQQSNQKGHYQLGEAEERQAERISSQPPGVLHCSKQRSLESVEPQGVRKEKDAVMLTHFCEESGDVSSSPSQEPQRYSRGRDLLAVEPQGLQEGGTLTARSPPSCEESGSSRALGGLLQRALPRLLKLSAEEGETMDVSTVSKADSGTERNPRVAAITAAERSGEGNKDQEVAVSQRWNGVASSGQPPALCPRRSSSRCRGNEVRVNVRVRQTYVTECVRSSSVALAPVTAVIRANSVHFDKSVSSRRPRRLATMSRIRETTASSSVAPACAGEDIQNAALPAVQPGARRKRVRRRMRRQLGAPALTERRSTARGGIVFPSRLGESSREAHADREMSELVSELLEMLPPPTGNRPTSKTDRFAVVAHSGVTESQERRIKAKRDMTEAVRELLEMLLFPNGERDTSAGGLFAAGRGLRLCRQDVYPLQHGGHASSVGTPQNEGSEMRRRVFKESGEDQMHSRLVTEPGRGREGFGRKQQQQQQDVGLAQHQSERRMLCEPSQSSKRAEQDRQQRERTSAQAEEERYERFTQALTKFRDLVSLKRMDGLQPVTRRSMIKKKSLDWGEGERNTSKVPLGTTNWQSRRRIASTTLLHDASQALPKALPISHLEKAGADSSELRTRRESLASSAGQAGVETTAVIGSLDVIDVACPAATDLMYGADEKLNTSGGEGFLSEQAATRRKTRAAVVGEDNQEEKDEGPTERGAHTKTDYRRERAATSAAADIARGAREKPETSRSVDKLLSNQEAPIPVFARAADVTLCGEDARPEASQSDESFTKHGTAIVAAAPAAADTACLPVGELRTSGSEELLLKQRAAIPSALSEQRTESSPDSLTTRSPALPAAQLLEGPQVVCLSPRKDSEHEVAEEDLCRSPEEQRVRAVSLLLLEQREQLERLQSVVDFLMRERELQLRLGYPVNEPDLQQQWEEEQRRFDLERGRSPLGAAAQFFEDGLSAYGRPETHSVIEYDAQEGAAIWEANQGGRLSCKGEAIYAAQPSDMGGIGGEHGQPVCSLPHIGPQHQSTNLSEQDIAGAREDGIVPSERTPAGVHGRPVETDVDSRPPAEAGFFSGRRIPMSIDLGSVCSEEAEDRFGNEGGTSSTVALSLDEREGRLVSAWTGDYEVKKRNHTVAPGEPRIIFRISTPPSSSGESDAEETSVNVRATERSVSRLRHQSTRRE